MGMFSGKPNTKTENGYIKEIRPAIVWGPVLYSPTINYSKDSVSVSMEIKVGKTGIDLENDRMKGMLKCTAAKKISNGAVAKVMQNVQPGDYVVAFGNLVTEASEEKKKVTTRFSTYALYPMNMMASLNDMIYGTGDNDNDEPDNMEI